ncbi:hypothetical protein BE18_40570 [Sorangium cellulosum]|uniref:Uncharacterized protein n=1 Tax=Sorangium cellulosum TaxID=56 RepID=A0A150RLY3_SORCE|nr:hypothetical protein BE18_40570 [Sorangium cellulosum]
MPYVVKLSPTCAASSRVGVSTSTRSPRWVGAPLCARRCRIGKANAAVLPVPVCAHPRTSLPSRIGGMACCWIGVGVLYPSASMARSSGSMSLRSANSMDIGLVESPS